MRVYYRITVYEVDVVRIDRAGFSVDVATPDSINKLRLWHLPPESVLRHPKANIARIHREGAWAANLVPGSRYEWTVRCSYNSIALHQQRVFSYPGTSPGH